MRKLSNALTVFSTILVLSCVQKKEKNLVRPNILLIVADDLGYTDLGCYGSEISTPHLDALAKNGILNTAFYTLPTCSPTRSMLLTGVDNHRTGYGTMEGDWADNQKGLRGYEGYLNFDVVTFPKLLQDNNYHTSMVGKWHQALPANEESLWPDKRGFERSFSLLEGGAGHFDDQQKLFSFFERSHYQADGKIVDTLPDDFYSTNYYTDKAIEFINESQELGQPFLSYVAYTTPHWPLQAPDNIIDKYKGKYDDGYEVLADKRLEKAKKLGVIPQGSIVPPRTPNVIPWNELNKDEQAKSSRIMEVYAAMVENLDTNVGRIIEHLKSIGQYENTLIVFMADNGAEGNNIGSIVDTKEWISNTFDNSLENIGRENSYVYTGPSWAQVSSLPFKWYKGFSTEGGVRCPSIISYPKWKQNYGQINDGYISVKDLAPTFLELAEAKHPIEEYEGRKIYSMDGTSLLSWLNGTNDYAHEPEKVHCWELYGRRAVLKGVWKAEWHWPPHGSGQWQLYHLENDPSELNNLADQESQILNELIRAWDDYALKYNVTLPNENTGYGIDEVWVEAKI